MDKLVSNKIPHNLIAEQALLGSMIGAPSCIADVIDLQVKAEDFYSPQNRDIYSAIYSMFNLNQTIDPITVIESVKKIGNYEESELRQYVLQLLDVTPTAANVKEYAQIVKDKGVSRNLLEVLSDIGHEISEDNSDAATLLDSAEQKMFSIRNSRNDMTLSPVKEVMVDIFQNLQTLSSKGGKIPGISTGFGGIDNVIGGLNKSDLILLAARPGMGKSSMALNIALNAAKQNVGTVCVFSLEMSKYQLGTRLISSEAFIDSKKLLTGDLNDEDWANIARSIGVLSSLDIRLDDNPSITVPEMKAKCMRIKNLGLVVIDYLQLMHSGRKIENRVTEVGEISRSLKIMAKELNVPVLCLSQLRREAEKGSDKRPMLSDLRESGSIEQDADIVMFLYRDEYYNEDTEDKNVAECIVAKNRHGETNTVKLQWVGQYTSFANLEWKYD